MMRQWLLALVLFAPPAIVAPPQYDVAGASQSRSDVTAIETARAASNRAIAAHDLDSFLPMFADDAVFTWSNGSHAVGKKELAAFFRRDFADPDFDRYVRTPQIVRISDRSIRASEQGTWVALKRDTRYGGNYSAHWMKNGVGWRVVGELYVKLYCSGPLCTPRGNLRFASITPIIPNTDVVGDIAHDP